MEDYLLRWAIMSPLIIQKPRLCKLVEPRLVRGCASIARVGEGETEVSLAERSKNRIPWIELKPLREDYEGNEARILGTQSLVHNVWIISVGDTNMGCIMLYLNWSFIV
jgi:hypothetical protein